MRTIYQIDGDQIATGAYREIGPKEGRPRGWVTSDTPPPDGLAQWSNGGWLLLDARPSPPDVYPDVETAREAMLGFINDLTKKITDQYPSAEVSAWPSKAEAARAVIAGTARADQTTLIQDEADLVGATLVDQAAAIVAKAEVFEAIVAKVSGLRQVTDASLVAATTSAEREAVLEKAEVLAAALAEAYGLFG
jgi:molybdopterin synthase catalytic subunit